MQKILFAIHEAIIGFLFGNADDYKIRHISPKLVNELNKYFTNNASIKFLSPGYNSSRWVLTNKLPEEVEIKLDDQLKYWFFDGSSKLALDLQGELRNLFSNNLRSPFCFVNIRAWSTRPKSEAFGPNTLHLDGFYRGHLKVMLYLTPLSASTGAFQLENKVITDLPAGAAVLFKNDKINHAAIPGDSKDRLSMEITLFRSFINQDIFHQCHHNGRHYKSVFAPYLRMLKKFISLRPSNYFCPDGL
ncbi:hypothetical protein SynPROS91_00194 [Synechococcus sp. PROS-9-1]|uniref:hypothetical protein n=1 Tax=Synechococcus sp. PROS-9-1 TaxID=1968775 RepID=UPI001645111E|nr:hypothetical protein [Synechococcus sp. PROS-9-1]QNJ30622.1 hypothetical protein SynPROS91_00194 [Synechococcus sp. PROS-9-1]